MTTTLDQVLLQTLEQQGTRLKAQMCHDLGGPVDLNPMIHVWVDRDRLTEPESTALIPDMVIHCGYGDASVEEALHCAWAAVSGLRPAYIGLILDTYLAQISGHEQLRQISEHEQLRQISEHEQLREALSFVVVGAGAAAAMVRPFVVEGSRVCWEDSYRIDTRGPILDVLVEMYGRIHTDVRLDLIHDGFDQAVATGEMTAEQMAASKLVMVANGVTRWGAEVAFCRLDPAVTDLAFLKGECARSDLSLDLINYDDEEGPT